ncbi:MAG TPA: hypothetical protein VJN44_15145, partial [Roseateles sp.]|nr:hypothetical protein [Roseateles sp.]
MTRTLGRALPVVATALLAAGCATQAPTPSGPVSVKVLAINDFHGNLKPSPGGIRLKGEDPQEPNKLVVVPAGGAESLHTAVAELRRAN